MHLYIISTHGNILCQSLGECDMTSEETTDFSTSCKRQCAIYVFIFQHVWSQLYRREAFQQGNGTAQVWLGPVFFCACCRSGYKKAELLRPEFWCFPSAHCCCFNIVSSRCARLEAITSSLPSAKPDTPWQDFRCCLFQVELEISAMCWLFLIQSLPGRQRQH